MNSELLIKKIEKEIERYKKDFKIIKINEVKEASELAGLIDHTVLKAETSPEDIKKLCKEAVENKFFSVCINPVYVSLAKEYLKGTDVKIATVIGFPLGANDTSVKAFETQIAREDGADEFDMVINVGLLKSKNYDMVYEDINSVVEAADGKTVKVIIETCYLETEDKIAACVISKFAGADFVKTSTGFGSGGAKSEDVALMKFVSGNEMKVKASGGIRDFETAREMIEAGAERLGVSAGLKIIKGLKSDSNY